MPVILYNGDILEKDKVSISYEDRGYYFGDGVYEVFRIYNGHVFMKEAHFERLKRSAAAIKLGLHYTVTEIDRWIHQLLELDQLKEGIVYLQLTRGIAPRTHTFPHDIKPSILAYCKPLDRPIVHVQKGIRAITLDDIRWHRCDIKSLNLIPNTMAKQEATERGVDDAILHRNGTITECSASNILIVKNNALHTHPADHYILHGITREVVLRLAQELGIEIVLEPFQVSELLEADEALATGTTTEITPIIEVDHNPIGDGQPGKITRQLQAAFELEVGKC